MKITIVGAGCMGSTFGGILKRAGADVTFIDPNEAHIRAIRENGLHIQPLGGEEMIIHGIKACTTADEAEKTDIIVLQVKGQFLASALDNCNKIAKEDSVLCVLMNGWGAVDFAKEHYVNPGLIVYGPPNYGASWGEPGTTKPQGIGPGTQLTTFVSETHNPICKEKVAVLTEYFKLAGYDVPYDDHADLQLWKKIGMNCIVNGTCGITRLYMKDWYANRYGVEIANLLAREVVAVANAKGIPLQFDDLHKFCCPTHVGDPYMSPIALAPHLPSTAQDIRAKMPTEIFLINGGVVLEGQKLGIPTPYNEMICKLVQAIETSYDKQQF